MNTTRPLGMLAVKQRNGAISYIEVTEISRIIHMPDDFEPAEFRSRVRLKGGECIDSTASATMLVGLYHDIIRGKPPAFDPDIRRDCIGD